MKAANYRPVFPFSPHRFWRSVRTEEWRDDENRYTPSPYIHTQEAILVSTEHKRRACFPQKEIPSLLILFMWPHVWRFAWHPFLMWVDDSRHCNEWNDCWKLAHHVYNTIVRMRWWLREKRKSAPGIPFIRREKESRSQKVFFFTYGDFQGFTSRISPLLPFSLLIRLAFILLPLSVSDCVALKMGRTRKSFKGWSQVVTWTSDEELWGQFRRTQDACSAWHPRTRCKTDRPRRFDVLIACILPDFLLGGSCGGSNRFTIWPTDGSVSGKPDQVWVPCSVDHEKWYEIEWQTIVLRVRSEDGEKTVRS